MGQSSQSWCLRLQTSAGGSEAEGLGFCRKMMGSHGGCVSRGAAESDWEGSGQGLGLTWAPLLAATPRSGTNSSQPPAIPAAPWTCCLSCGLWPPWGQKEQSVRSGRQGRTGQQPSTWAQHQGSACHQLHSPGQGLSLPIPVSLSVTQRCGYFTRLQRGRNKLVLEKHMRHC